MASRSRPAQCEPLRPGDAEVAAEVIEAFYLADVERARAELTAVRRRLERARTEAETAIAAFRSGQRLPQLDAWQIEGHAAGVLDAGSDLQDGRATDRGAQQKAKARHAAVVRWLRHEGYESVDGAR